MCSVLITALVSFGHASLWAVLKTELRGPSKVLLLSHIYLRKQEVMDIG